MASLAPIVPPLPAAPAPKPVVPPAPAPGPARLGRRSHASPDSPLQLKIGGTTIIPIGFMDFTNTWRSTADGDSLKTNFGKFPYNNSLPLARDTEDKLSLQNSRIGARFDGAYKDWHYLGYWESDFVGDFAGNSTQVTSNSVLFRLRLYWVNLRNKHFEVQAGQSWSLLTPNRNGLSALPGDLFYGQEFDVNYLNGLTWGRIPGIRFLYHSTGDKINFGVSLENADQYFGGYGGASTPALPAAFASNFYGNQIDGGQTNDVNVPQLMPDIIAKLAIQPNSRVHVEVAGVASQFKVFNSTTNTSLHDHRRRRIDQRELRASFRSSAWSPTTSGAMARAAICSAKSRTSSFARMAARLPSMPVPRWTASRRRLASSSFTPTTAASRAARTLRWTPTERPRSAGAITDPPTPRTRPSRNSPSAGFTRCGATPNSVPCRRWCSTPTSPVDPFYVAANSAEERHTNAIWFDLRYVLPGSAPTIQY